MVFSRPGWTWRPILSDSDGGGVQLLMMLGYFIDGLGEFRPLLAELLARFSIEPFTEGALMGVCLNGDVLVLEQGVGDCCGPAAMIIESLPEGLGEGRGGRQCMFSGCRGPTHAIEREAL